MKLNDKLIRISLLEMLSLTLNVLLAVVICIQYVLIKEQDTKIKSIATHLSSLQADVNNIKVDVAVSASQLSESKVTVLNNHYASTPFWLKIVVITVIVALVVYLFNWVYAKVLGFSIKSAATSLVNPLFKLSPFHSVTTDSEYPLVSGDYSFLVRLDSQKTQVTEILVKRKNDLDFTNLFDFVSSLCQPESLVLDIIANNPTSPTLSEITDTLSPSPAVSALTPEISAADILGVAELTALIPSC